MGTALFIAIVVSAHASHPLDWGDSGLIGPKYSQILSSLDSIADLHPQLVRKVSYGKSVQGRTLRLYVVAKQTQHFKSRPTLFMSGSTHGNEYLNLEDRLPPEVIKRAQVDGPIRRYLDAGGAFVFVPILNPDGYENRSRENAHGVDLNRDWTVPPAAFQGLREQETRLLASKLDEMSHHDQLDYRVTVDYHCCIGALLHPWSYQKQELPPLDAMKHGTISELAVKELGIESGTTGQILGYYPMGTTKDYFYVKYGAAAFTYEGRHGKENEYFSRHVAWWESMASTLLNEQEALLATALRRKRHPFLAIAE